MYVCKKKIMNCTIIKSLTSKNITGQTEIADVYVLGHHGSRNSFNKLMKVIKFLEFDSIRKSSKIHVFSNFPKRKMPIR